MSDKEALLRKIPLFQSLDDEQLHELANHAVTRKYPKDAMLFEEGDAAEALYLVQDGKLKVMLGDAEGNDVIISILQGGDTFGEMALVDAEVRSARVMTMSPTTLLAISKTDFRRWLESSPQVAMALIQQLSLRLRRANRNIASLAMKDVGGRVAQVLMDHAEQVGDNLVVKDPPTQKDIASMVGASREMVNRTFKELVNEGIITVKDRMVVINEPPEAL